MHRLSKRRRNLCFVHKRNSRKLARCLSEVAPKTFEEVRAAVRMAGGSISVTSEGLILYSIRLSRDTTAGADFGPFTEEQVVQWAQTFESPYVEAA